MTAPEIPAPEIPGFKPGVTITLAVTQLEKVRGNTPITADTDVSFVVQDEGGEEIEANPGVFSGGEWVLTFNAPATPGSYWVLATAVVDGLSTWKGAGYFIVEPLR